MNVALIGRGIVLVGAEGNERGSSSFSPGLHLGVVGRALEMARSGEMADGHSALALLRCEPYLPEL